MRVPKVIRAITNPKRGKIGAKLRSHLSKKKKEKKKGPDADFSQFEDRINERLNILPFLEGLISDVYYNRLEQD